MRSTTSSSRSTIGGGVALAERGPGHRRSVRRVLIAATAAAITAASFLGAGAPAQAASAKHPRLIAVAASSGYLVYRQKTATAAGLLSTKHSTLYWVGRSGGRHLLKDFDPELFPTLQGSTLAQSAQPNAKDDPDHDPTLPEHVRWRDLRTGAHGTTRIPATDDYSGAAPGGWIAVRSSGSGAAARVVRYSTGGGVVDLGAPFAGSSPFTVTPGPKGVLVAARNDDAASSTGLIRYMPYATPGRWRTLYAAGAGHESTCGRPTDSAVVCDVHAVGPHSGEVLLSLTSSRKAWVSDHRGICRTTVFVAVGSSAVGKDTTDLGSCVRSRLTKLGPTGRVTHSRVRWGVHASGITAGLGRILLDSADQRRIVGVTGVRSAPHALVSAH